MLNSPLSEEPRNQRAPVIPLKQESSMMDWLQTQGRLVARNIQETEFSQQEAEISEFLSSEEGIEDYDMDDDSDVSIDED
ncbi:DUF3134 domain-containing protein [Nodularia spumigena CS-584]|jgi:hypothetical protein|uniref:DUF3134 domain-containing protein n=1 Tax=Nodularia spumigena UHCC 0060 TaxID=3110300 RepID=A0ABU5URJ7_NODSP|nr:MULTISPECIES: DUF3134 domain-containing protein [Cyanophyceae]MDB9358094.1 DUF3134 domain-containing protein [Nodularia spumigena CS-587/03]AHJ28179.1 hypothetical protein NSP_18460 [Nodularia spumigena CCY9414]EAW46708.1 hypothetical protein N9414_17063 [Nodularia spumigena CCY9414]MDB9306644.1 DUF3134 domain-containing protein [Nodularia spumigena CS-591/12]MDB9316119.1 DUF3134 domain-containing protein [Nodularia spumigena CS-590/01A]